MNYIPPPITYAKVNPLGQLVIGLENGTILNAGNVSGKQGIPGPTGSIGICGPTGPIGPYMTNMKINEKGELTYQFTQHNQILNAGRVPGITGPQGPRGNSIVNCNIHNRNLYVELDNGKAINAGHVIGATGPRGQMGMLGPTGATGPVGKPFTVSRIFTTNDLLFLMDENNRMYNCGYIGVTGPTGPPAIVNSFEINESGHLIVDENFDAGLVKGPSGEQGPTGPKGRPGPMLRFKNIVVSDKGELIFTDEFDKQYNTGVLPIIEQYENRLQTLEKQVAELLNKNVI